MEKGLELQNGGSLFLVHLLASILCIGSVRESTVSGVEAPGGWGLVLRNSSALWIKLRKCYFNLELMLAKGFPGYLDFSYRFSYRIRRTDDSGPFHFPWCNDRDSGTASPVDTAPSPSLPQPLGTEGYAPWWAPRPLRFWSPSWGHVWLGDTSKPHSQLQGQT